MICTLKVEIVPKEVPKAEGQGVWVPIELYKDVDAFSAGEKASEPLLRFIPKNYIVTATQVSWP